MDARQEAEKRFHGRRRHVGLVTDREIEAFVAGAYYATSPDNTEAVEAVARALRDDKANRTDNWHVPEWENLPEGFRIEFRSTAKATLTALHELMKGERQ